MRGDGTGVSLLHRVRELRPALAAGLMTSLPASDSLRNLAASEFAILPKPFDPAALDAFIRQCTLASLTAAH